MPLLRVLFFRALFERINGQSASRSSEAISAGRAAEKVHKRQTFVRQWAQSIPGLAEAPVPSHSRVVRLTSTEMMA
jgi:hypothetical protein